MQKIKDHHKKSLSRLKGRQLDDQALEKIQRLLGFEPLRRDLLIEYLHRIQDQYGGLSSADLAALAGLMKLSQAEVFEVASFYHHFKILEDGQTPPSLIIRVCDGLSCSLSGAESLISEIEGLEKNSDIEVQRVPCVGRCEQAPVAVTHQNPVLFATSASVSKAVAEDARNHPPASDQGQFFLTDYILKSVTGHCDLLAQDVNASPAYMGFDVYVKNGGYELLRSVVTGDLKADEILQTLEHSGLRGLGGAGFPAARKWRIVRNYAAPRVMAVNIDEGEPGTFKDRTYLERDPHRFLEGMLLAAHVVGIHSCYIYLRDEYHGCRALLQAELDLLQRELPLDLPRIELRRGAGAYICGEESAMIESIEGKRGVPRMRPPYIAEVGLFGRPTLEHNFETLYWLRDILTKGAKWFSSFGRNGRVGLRSFSVSGRVKRPGVKLAPAGISVCELIDEYCGGMQVGHQFYAYLPGGASGGILPASMGNIPLDFDTLQPYGCLIGSAAVVILSDQDRAKRAAATTMRFFAHESCGQCTPCRVGTEKATQLMRVDSWDWQTLLDIGQVMEDASICGLGQAAPNPIRCIHQYFKDEDV